MSTDSRKREAARRAASDPTDQLAAAQAAAEAERSGEPTDLRYLAELVGAHVYIEGARLNWHGILVAVDASPTGGPASLRLGSAHRLVNWTSTGPTVQESVGDGHDVLIPWSYVHMIGRAPSRWPKP